KKIFGGRWHIETCTSMDKRCFGDEIKGRSYWSQCRELCLIALVHNIGSILFFVLAATRRRWLSSFSLLVTIFSTEQ
ncbi:MAG: hypothetical protein ABIH42_10685, partial [Planctomycetota bacterium]